MKRWNCRSPWVFPRRCRARPASTRLWAVGTARCGQPLVAHRFSLRCISTQDVRPSDQFRYAVFDKLSRPPKEIDAWTALLDAALPEYLRLPSSSPVTSTTLDATDVAEVLLAAQYPKGSLFDNDGFDLLFHLGFTQGRWDAVIWIVKTLVEKFPVRHNKVEQLSAAISQWQGTGPLSAQTSKPIKLTENNTKQPLRSPTLHELTDGSLEDFRREQLLQHNALGQIWRSLGTMAQACAGGDIRPEVLELVAYIHHHGFMPEAIYRYSTHANQNAIQQPPLLSLLSSRILTSLSDAAWRAHERTIVEEARSKGGEYAGLRPELPGSVYRVNVAGLRPEVWIELILWSSLHGGWILHGVAILRAIIQEKAPHLWKPLSWREYEKELAPNPTLAAGDWENLDYLFKTRDVSSMDDPSGPTLEVERTVSAEVVNAYIDALVNSVSVGVGERGALMEPIIAQLHQFKNFLSRSNLSLITGSWDAIILRLIDSQSTVPEHDSGTIQNLVSLSPGIGQGLQSKNTTDLPTYVLDGNAAIQGLLHRAMHGRIAAGSLDGALAVFKALQERTDTERRKSLVSFLSGRSSSLFHRAATTGMFTSNFPGIDYPALDMQISPIILGRFLDLVTDAKAYDFGHWLLHSQDVDGPVIGPNLYKDPAVQPAILRFAAETNDKVLLGQFKGDSISMDTLRSLFDSQVNAGKWDSAVRLLNHMKLVYHNTWSVANLANISRAIMLHSQIIKPGRDSEEGDVPRAKRDVHRARSLFADMVRGRYEGVRFKEKEESIQTLLWILSTIDHQWAESSMGLQILHGPVAFRLGITAFNTVLQGVAEIYGSADAQRLLETFWPQAVRDAFKSSGDLPDKRGRMKMSRYRPEVLQSIARHRISLRPLGTSSGENEVVLLGGLEPLPSTILIVFKRAIEEFRTASESVSKTTGGVSDMLVGTSSRTGAVPNVEQSSEAAVMQSRHIVAWALRRLNEVQPMDSTALQQIGETLDDHGMQDLKAQLPALSRHLAGRLSRMSDDGTTNGSIKTSATELQSEASSVDSNPIQ